MELREKDIYEKAAMLAKKITEYQSEIYEMNKIKSTSCFRPHVIIGLPSLPYGHPNRELTSSNDRGLLLAVADVIIAHNEAQIKQLEQEIKAL